MEYDTKAFFSEHDAHDVTGFAIIEVDENSEQYRVVEKWERPDSEGGPRWLTYWIPEAALLERVRDDSASYKQQLSDKQHRGMLKLAGIAEQYA